jgi:hypothetical protein
MKQLFFHPTYPLPRRHVILLNNSFTFTQPALCHIALSHVATLGTLATQRLSISSRGNASGEFFFFFRFFAIIFIVLHPPSR